MVLLPFKYSAPPNLPALEYCGEPLDVIKVLPLPLLSEPRLPLLLKV